MIATYFVQSGFGYELPDAQAAPLPAIIDDGGADDEPGQKDLNQMTIDFAPASGDLVVTWNWDDTSVQGNNTLDGCSLYDTNGDGLADYSLCVIGGGDPVEYESTVLYSCNNSRSDRCAGPTELDRDADGDGTLDSGSFGSACDAAITSGDPFHAGQDDFVATCTIDLDDFGGAASAGLINVCSYPSQEPNSDPSDCVVAPDSGFLTIVKQADPNDGTTFNFTSSVAANDGSTSWSVTGSGNAVTLESFGAGTLDLTESVPGGWQLDGASCQIQNTTLDATGTPTATGVTGVEIQAGLETICTFANSLAEGTITLIKTVDNLGESGEGYLGVADFPLSVDGTPVTSGDATTVTAGSHTIAETPQTGYAVGTWSCDNGQTGSAGSATLDITIGGGQDVICEITNTLVADPLLSIDKTVTGVDTAGNGALDTAGEIIGYSIVATNNGNVTLTNVTVTDPLIGTLSCAPTQPATLAPGEAITCTGSYAITQGDLDGNGGGDGDIDNTATADSAETDPVEASQAVPLNTDAMMTVVKSADVASLSAPQTVTYSYLVTNTGNVTLTGISLVDDNIDGAVTCPADTLAVDANMTCTATHTFTQAELDANGSPTADSGSLSNNVTASSNEAPDALDDLDIPISRNADFTITKSVTGTDSTGDGDLDAPGDIIDYEIVVTNTGNVTLTNVTVTDPLLGTLTCAPVQGSSLAPTEAMTCTGSYPITQTDLNTNGGGDGDIDNTATATSDEAGPKDASAEAQLALDPSLSIVKTVVTIDGDENGSANSAGDIIVYQVVVTNTGNVDLSPSVSDVLTQSGVDTTLDMGTVTESFGDDDVMEPTETWTYAFSYEVTQAVLDDGGSLFNEACASNADPLVVEVCSEVETPLAITPAIDIVKTGSLDVGADGIATPGDLVTYTFTVTNDGNVTLSDVTVTDPLTGLSEITCDWAGSSNGTTGNGVLAVGETVSCSATYALTQADIDLGMVENLATADGTTPTGGNVDDTDPHDETVPQGPALSVVKSLTGNADEDGSGTVSLNDTLTYTLTATNDGNTTLHNVTVDDSLTGDSTTCASVAPGDTCVLIVTYVVTQADVDAAIIENTGTADSDETPPDEDDEDVPVPQDPSIDADKVLLSNADEDGNGGVSLGDTLTFRITATNDGNVTLSNVTVDDDLTGTVDAACAATLAPGQSCFVDVTYVVTQPDVDASKVENTGTVEGNPPIGDPVSDSDPEEVPVPQNPSIDADKVLFDNADEDGSGTVSLDDTLTYRITATNTGNVTLTDVTVQDVLTGTIGAFCAASLAPGESCFVDVTYVVTQDDVDTGVIDNLGEVEGTDPNNDPVTDDDPETVPVPQNPAIDLVKSASDIDNTVAGPDDRTDVGDQITYTFTITNIGNVTLDALALDDALVGFSDSLCDDADGVLGVGESTDCTAVYGITQADIDAGERANTAFVSAEGPQDQPVDDEDGTTTPITQSPALAIVKVFTSNNDEDGSGTVSLGDRLFYDLVATNVGNMTLTNVTVEDSLTGDLAVCASVAPGGTCELTVSWVVTQADVDAGEITNVGTADSNETDPVEDPELVDVPQNPSIDIVKSGAIDDAVVDPSDRTDAGDVIDYTFVVTNDGDVTLSDVTVTDPLAGLSAITCDWAASDPATPAGTLAVGESVTCAAEYGLLQSDIDAGEVINTADADGSGPLGQPVNDDDTNTEPITQDPQLAVSKEADVSEVDAAGDVITYTVTVENTGNITLDPIVTDEINGLVPVPLSGPAADIGLVGLLDVGEIWTFSGTYEVTQDDMDAGVALTNVACADDPGVDGEDDCGEDTTTIIQEPSIELLKTGTWNDANGDTYANAGETITYTFSVENTGNVTVTNITLADTIGGVTISGGPISTLAPGAIDSTTFSGEYVLTQVDVDAGTFTNVATATGQDPDGDPVEDDDDDVQNLPQNPVLGIVKLVSRIDSTDGVPFLTSVDADGDVIVYEIVVSNDGNVTLTNIQVTDPLLADVSCPVTTLLVNQSMSCFGSYEVTQADLDDNGGGDGDIDNTATATSDQDGPETSSVEVPVIQNPAIDLVKTASAIDNTVAGPDDRTDSGDQVTYSFEITNTGNVTLSSVALEDALVGFDPAVTCGGVSELAPGASTDCTAVYDIVQADIDAGLVANTATATGEGPQGQPVDDTEGTNTPITQEPAIVIDKEGALVIDVVEPNDRADAGDRIDYTFDVENTGNVTLSSVVVSDPLGGGLTVSCGLTSDGDAFANDGTDTLDPGETVQCSASYTLTQADLDAGTVDNTGFVDSVDPNDEPVDDDDPNTESVPQVVTIDLEKSASAIDNTVAGPTDRTDAGDQITYTFEITNTGNVTLSSVDLTDALVGFAGAVCGGADELAPGASTDCTAVYDITQADIDAGERTNSATATGEGPQGQPAEDTDGTQTPIVQEPAHALTKTFVPDQVGDGEAGTFELVYTNTGNTTLTDIDIFDDVDERLRVDNVSASAAASCTDPDGDPQTVLCEVDSLAPDGTVTVTVQFTALGDDFGGIGPDESQTSGANYVFYFANGYVLYGSTDTGEATLLDENRDAVTDPWSVDGANQDIYFTAPYDLGGPGDLGFQLHLSCSEAFIDGWGSTGPIEGVDHPDWEVIAYDVFRFNTNGFLKDCSQTFPFDVPNTATASATPPSGTLDDVEASDTLEVINIAPIEISRERVRRGDVEIQYFNTSQEPLFIDIIRIEWFDDGTQLELASYQDGVQLAIGLEAGDNGCYNGLGTQPADVCRLQANIDPATQIDARSKDWLKLSFDPAGAPDGLTVTIVTDDGATFTYEFGS